MIFASVRSAMGALLLALATCHGVALAQAPGEADLVPAPADAAPASPAAPPPLAAALEPAPAEMVLAHGDPIARSGSSSTAKGPGGLTWGEVPALETLGPAHAIASAASAWPRAASPGDSLTTLTRLGVPAEVLSAAGQSDQERALAYVTRGQAELDRPAGDLNAVMADLNAALAFDPRSVVARVGRAVVWLKKNRPDEAIADLDEAIRLDPAHANCYFVRGVARWGRGEFDKAIDDYSEAIRLHPGYVDARLQRGSLRLGRREYQKAIDDFSAVIADQPRHSDAHALRAIARMRRREYEAALTDLDRAIRFDVRNVRAHMTIAWLLASCPDPKCRDGEEAISHLADLEGESQESQAEVLQARAAAWAEAGVFGKAVEVQARANALLTDDEQRNKGESRLRLYRDHKPYRLEE